MTIRRRSARRHPLTLTSTLGSIALGSLKRVAVVALCLSFASAANAESQLLLPFPDQLGDIPAATYNDQGQAVGPATILFEEIGGDRVRLKVESSIAGGATNSVEAVLEIVGDREALRLISERTQSHDAAGTSLGVLEIDHQSGEASCQMPGTEASEATVLPLPKDDRVANVPMNVLFLPLIRGEVDQIKFQIFLCRGGPRFLDFVALRGRSGSLGESSELVEVRYGPDLGNVLSWAASRVLPKLSFWFDTSEGGRYAAHRLPLFARGPEVTVIRDGFSPQLFKH